MNTPNQNRPKFRFLAMMMLLPFMASVSYSAVIYQETFGNASGAQVSLTSQGITDWTEIQTMTGTSVASGNNLYPNGSMGSTGSTTNIGSATGTANAYYQDNYGVYRMQAQYSTAANAQSVYASGLSLDPTSTNYSFQWYQNNGSLGSSARVLLQEGGSWYVSSTSFTTVAGTTTQETFSYDPTAANWFLLSTTAAATNGAVTDAQGNFLLTSPAPSALSGSITAVGWLMLDSYYNTNGAAAAVSFDNFSISASAVPEPATYVLFGFGALVLIVAYRRRSA